MAISPPRYLIILGLIFAAAGCFAVRFPDSPRTTVDSLVSTLLIALPTLVAFWRFIGARSAVLSFAALSALGFAVETTGIATGFPYGDFYYGDDALGPKVAGMVP
jgi:bisanhydrobacterioruberin hydratase